MVLQVRERQFEFLLWIGSTHPSVFLRTALLPRSLSSVLISVNCRDIWVDTNASELQLSPRHSYYLCARGSFLASWSVAPVDLPCTCQECDASQGFRRHRLQVRELLRRNHYALNVPL